MGVGVPKRGYIGGSSCRMPVPRIVGDNVLLATTPSLRFEKGGNARGINNKSVFAVDKL